MATIICFGEVLWDVFPTHKKIGGAPLNVALRLDSLENEVMMISSVGDDSDGKAILKYLDDIEFNRTQIQINREVKTGKVLVSLDVHKTASYSIEFPSAWDYISLNDTILNYVKNADAFVFGSLVARNEMSYSTLLNLLDVAAFKVFDVNLRPPHYKMSVLIELMKKADCIKFNDEELYEICKKLDFTSSDLKQNIEFISNETETDTICVTQGKNGAVLYIGNNYFHNPGYTIKTVDTVGAGDSFLAALIDGLLKNESPQKGLDFACAVGALVAASEGANPIISKTSINEILR